jgi:hypothetical protein
VTRLRPNKSLCRIGEALLAAIQTPLSGALVPIGAEALHVLGKRLIRVAKRKEDARIVFEQKKIGRPSQSERDLRIASIYWLARAQGATHKRGIKVVRDASPALKLADSGIQKVAQKLMVQMIGRDNTATAPPGEAPNGIAGALDFAKPELNLHALELGLLRRVIAEIGERNPAGVSLSIAHSSRLCEYARQRGRKAPSSERENEQS